MPEAGSGTRVFSYDEAVALLPEVRRLTEAAYQRVSALGVGTGAGVATEEVQGRIEEIVGSWAQAVIGMGIEVKGLWLIDFDNGSGYYCWRHPETSLQYFHGYDEGYSGRVKLN